jgi:hypothetical protein
VAGEMAQIVFHVCSSWLCYDADYVTLSDGIIDELERMWKEMIMSNLRYYPNICLEGLMETRNMASHLLHGVIPLKTTVGIFTVLKMLILVVWNTLFCSVKFIYFHMHWDCPISRVTRYRLEGRRIGVHFPKRARNFSLLHNIQPGSGAYPASYTVSTRGRVSFPGAKWIGHEADHSFSSSAEVKNE